MENASKALIIAASVLIAIMIIAMGVTIFNNAQNMGDTTALDATEINMFNQKFERFSNNQLGSQVKSLISFAVTNASTNKDDPSKLPTIKYTQASGSTITAEGEETANGDIDTYIKQLGKIRQDVTSTHTYKVLCDYGTTGLINSIEIKY